MVILKGHSDADGVPIWLRIVFRQGVATAIAAWLVYFLSVVLYSSVKKIGDDLTTHSATSNFYLRAICLNTAQNDAQRSNCLREDH